MDKSIKSKSNQYNIVVKPIKYSRLMWHFLIGATCQSKNSIGSENFPYMCKSPVIEYCID